MSESSELLTASPSPPRAPRCDRHFWLAIALATLVLLVRGGLIMRAHSEILDSQFHLRSGMMLLTGDPAGMINTANDAPFGQELMALPIWLLRLTPDKPIVDANWPAGVSKPGEMPASEPAMPPDRAEKARTLRRAILYGNRLSPRAILVLVGVWKSILFVPCIGVIFQWCRQLYGVRSAWLAIFLVLVDPTFAAHIPVVALDTLGVEGIVLACYGLWRYFEKPTPRGLIIASVAVALAMFLKHTAVILPAFALLMAAWYRIVVSRWKGQPIRIRFGPIARAGLIMLLTMWIFTGFDWSIPSKQFQGAVPRYEHPSRVREIAFDMLDRPWPAGTYLGRFVSGYLTSQSPHRAWLWGEMKMDGWWYYFPIVATYKVPIGIFVVLLLGALSFSWRRLREEEMSLLIPLVCWCFLLMTSKINMGFRHFLPAYVFMLMLAARCVAAESPRLGSTELAEVRRGFWTAIIAYLAILIAGVHVTLFHPDYLSYLSYPRDRWWMEITESNMDWGQSLPEIAKWIDAHPQPPGKTISVVPRWDRQRVSYEWYIGSRRAKLFDRGDIPPTSGILIISPVWVTGVYDIPYPNPYEFVQSKKPIDVIGHSQLVYDLDAP